MNAVSLIEAKLDRSRNTDWSEVLENGFGHLSGADLRLNYWWQVQCQLYCTGLSVGYLAVWTVFNFYLIEIEADEAAAEVIAQVGPTVMAWVVDSADRLPAPTDADGLRTIASTVRPASEGPIEVDGAVAEALAAYVSLGKQIDALDEQRDAAKRIILDAHNAGAKLASANGIKSSFIAASERVSLDTKKLETDHPALVADYRKVTQVAASCRVTAPRSKG
jgi:predicted phage-related endonuclease